MDINLTAIARSFRVYAIPTTLIATSLIMLWLLGPGSEPSPRSIEMMLQGVREKLRWFALLVLVAGVLGAIYSTWELHQWRQGKLSGGCHNCGGSTMHRSGRYGPYSICKMCGSKREGHH